MRVLLGTNVILDVLHQRHPWSQDATAIWQATAAGQLEGCVSASTVTDLYYISRRLAGVSNARGVVRTVLQNLTILPVTRSEVADAYLLAMSDFEDALQVVVALKNGLDALATRDVTGFAGAPITVLSPADLLTQLSGAEEEE